MNQSTKNAGGRTSTERDTEPGAAPEQVALDAETSAGREWDAMAIDVDDDDPRDAENIDLDIECINERLEREAGGRLR